MQKRGLYVEDVAVLFGLSSSTVQRQAREGKLPAVKQGGRWVFNPKKLRITWNAVMAGRKPSTKPKQDFQRLVWLVEDIASGDAVIFEEDQREALDLVLKLLGTRFGAQVWRLIESVRGNSYFAFLELVPRLVPIH